MCVPAWNNYWYMYVFILVEGESHGKIETSLDIHISVFHTITELKIMMFSAIWYKGFEYDFNE